MGLQVEESKHDVHTGPLHLPRPADVVGLVEPRLEFHQRRDVLARLGRGHEGAGDGGVATGAIERLLDGEHPGIRGGGGHELDDRIERLVRMVEEDVALGDGREDVGAAAFEDGGDAGRERFVVQPLEPGQFMELPERRQVERPVDPVDLAVVVALPLR